MYVTLTSGQKKQLVAPEMAGHSHCLYNQLQTVTFHTVDDSLTFKKQEPKNKKRPRHNVCTRNPWIPVSEANTVKIVGCAHALWVWLRSLTCTVVPRSHPQEEVWYYARPGYAGIRDTIEKSGTVPEIPGQLEPM